MGFVSRFTDKTRPLPGIPPRLLSAGWAVYAGMTATAYVTMNPVAQRGNVTQLPEPLLATVWGVIAVTLAVGAALPSGHAVWCRVGRQARVAGVTMLAAIFAAWASTYVIDGLTGHGTNWVWVVGRNYMALTLAAVVSASHIAKNRAPERELPT